MTFQNVLDTFIHHDCHDAFAQSLGYSDAAQMVYYENMTMQAEGKSDAAALIMGYESADAITEELNRMEQEASHHELAKVDSREVYAGEDEFDAIRRHRETYTDSEDCPQDGDFSEWATAVFTDDLSGVY